jgi:gliding motility-associated-like protein
VIVAADAIASAGDDVSVCSGATAQLSGSGNGSYLWSPAAGLSSATVANPTVNPTTNTTYTLIVTTANGCTAQDEVTVSVFDGINLTLSGDTSICAATQTTLYASGADNYVWSPEAFLNNAFIANPIAQPPSTTTYTVTATDNNGCVANGTVVIEVYEQTLNPDYDTLLCKGEPLTLYAPQGSNYVWTYQQQTISSSSTANANTISGGTVQLNYLDDNGCAAAKQYIVQINNTCDFVVVPSAFSPNGDGKNDVFRIIKAGVKNYTMKIYNRWGQLIFETNDLNGGWDGNIQGVPAPVGTYVYVLLADLQNGDKVTQQGNVTLLR